MESKELRTPDKNLLIGVISKKNEILFLEIKNRGKEDCISLEALIQMVDCISKTLYN